MAPPVIEEYLGSRPSMERCVLLRAQRRAMTRVLNFDRKLFLSLVVKSRRRFFKKLGGSEKEIAARIEEYFTRQTRLEKLGQILTVLELQSVIVTEFTKTVGSLTSPMPAINAAVRRVDVSPAKDLTRRALESYMVLQPPAGEPAAMARHKHSDLVDVVKRLMKEHLRRNNKRCVCYGSYSLHLLNPEIEYGDIDMVQTNARPFLINLAFLIYFVTGRQTVLLRVPYLKSYVVLQDEEGGHILDSFNVRQATLRALPTLQVDNIYILHPFVQLMAALKMFSQTDRIFDLVENFDKARARMETLLAFAMEELECRPPVAEPSDRMPLPCAFARPADPDESAGSRVLEVDASAHAFGFSRAVVFLDEPVLVQKILDLGVPEDDIVDFESVSNSAFLVHGDTLYTHFSNTVLMDGDAVHDISRRAVTAHIVMFLLLTRHPAAEAAVREMLSTLVSTGRRVTAVVERSKKSGTHGVIDITRNVITH
ncbi:ORF018 poly-A polymerase catalytic subunit PAPL [Bovine papular stomatitis virus]|uniref:Poly(A) polymerase catalytic subunit n=1 Tax=Bovine papular stomatitis virus TaxID=129727 RepID=Q6TVH0_9POXV|nr:poly(A) polymerase large subunit [Bovine papular stomatitis virus]AAR98375.1 ORF018 poly-A polymerase catalytic subunit PAPL [Bovine papular stomatitis virus]